MSYLTFPRIHFSGQFKAYPATINNIDSNYSSKVYPNIEDVQLLWAPRGTGEIALVDCTITKVEYEDGTVATSPSEDAIIGQPIFSVPNPGFIAGALVDLDPDQQMVSEIWGMKIQIGGNDANVTGDFEPAAFNGMWGNVQGPNAPRSSASASVLYQSVLTNLVASGSDDNSQFLDYLKDNPQSKLSINFMIGAHNNNPLIYSFNQSTFSSLLAAGVPDTVLTKILPMQKLKQQDHMQLGDVPTKDFVTFQLQQYLDTEDYNANIDNILKLTQVEPYQPSTPYEFSKGYVCGTVGTSSENEPNYFVPSRMLATYNNSSTINKKPNPYFGLVNFAAFSVADDGVTISINLSNSLPVENPGTTFYQEKIGDIRLVYFPDGEVSIANAQTISEIPYMDPRFLNQGAGMFTVKSSVNVSRIPLGVISTQSNGTEVILLAENIYGYYLRADQFVFRMNPGVDSDEFPRGETATVNIHVLQFGEPAADGTEIFMNTIPTQGIGTPASALTITPATRLVGTKNGIASFTLNASDPGNPRHYINGQIYFKGYGFNDPEIANSYVPDPNDFVSVQVYNLQPDGEALDILNKYGYLYKIMSFLADDKTVEGLDMRNMIKMLLTKPYSSIKHMPVTRDMSDANRNKVISWIDQLNQS